MAAIGPGAHSDFWVPLARQLGVGYSSNSLRDGPGGGSPGAGSCVGGGEHFGDVRYRFHNVRGLSERAFRQYYLGRARATCDVLALAKTNCPSEEEAAVWGRDWRASAGGFWLPCPEGSLVGRV